MKIFRGCSLTAIVVMVLGSTMASDNWSVSRLEAKKESYMKVLKDQFDTVVAVTDGNRSVDARSKARSKESIDRLINSDPNMFDNSERSEMIYQIVERNSNWIIKMAPRGTGSKVKTMQFKVQSTPSEDPKFKKCSKVCNLKFRIVFDWKTKNGTEHHRLSKLIERELPKDVLGCQKDHCQAFSSLNFETEDPLPALFDAYQTAMEDINATEMKMKILPWGRQMRENVQDIWIVVNYEKMSRRVRREARQQYLPDHDRTCGLRRVEVNLDDWYPNLKDVVHSPKTFTFTFCEGSCEGSQHHMFREDDPRHFKTCCHAVESTHLELLLFDPNSDGYRHENSPSMLAQRCKCL